MAGLGLNSLPAFWTSASTASTEYIPTKETTVGDVTPGPTPQQLCTIQVTSENGALCIINPLFLAEHGDGWLTRAPPGPRGSHTRTTIRLKPSCDSVKITEKKTAVISEPLIQAEQSILHTTYHQEQEISISFPEADDRQTLLATNVRRKTLSQHPIQSQNGKIHSEVTGQAALDGESSRPKSAPQQRTSERRESVPVHSVSLIEEDHIVSHTLKKCRSESSLSSGDSFLLPPIPELDSLSVSSIEEEGDSHNTPPSRRKKRHTIAISDKVRHSFLAVSSAFGGLLPLHKRISKRILEMAQDSNSYFGDLVQGFLCRTLKGPSQHLTSTEMLQDIRETMSNLKTYLIESSELHAAVEHACQDDFDLDATVERALSKALLKPIKACIYSQLLEFHTKDGTLHKLRENQKKMKAQSLPQLGVTAGVPDAAAMDKIQQKLLLVHTLYSPKEKVIQLLKVCKIIYEAMNRETGKNEIYGADDFLPVLTYVLLGCDVTFLQLDVEYMMELLDPSQLHGEGGYYLTTVFGALFHIGNIQHSSVTRKISLEAQRSLHQWQRRRTINQSSSSSRKSQDILYISLREPFNNQKALTVPADMTTASVCAACSEKFQIHNKEDYGLFLFSDNEMQPLEANSCLQQVKARLAEAGVSTMVFVYKEKGV